MKTLLTSLATLLIGAVVGVLLHECWMARDGSEPTRGDAGSEARSFPPALSGKPRAGTGLLPDKGAQSLQAALAAPTEFDKFAALYQAAAKADAAGIRRMIFAANGIEAPWDRRSFLGVLYRRYAELDPAAAVDLVLETPYQDSGTYLAAVFQSWSRTDLQAAVDRARALDPWLREQAAYGLFSSEELRSSGRLREIARSLGLEQKLDDLELGWSLDRPPDADPAADWAVLVAANAGMPEMMHYWGLVQHWVRTDPYAAIQATLALDDVQLRSRVLAPRLEVLGADRRSGRLRLGVRPAGRPAAQSGGAVGAGRHGHRRPGASPGAGAAPGPPGSARRHNADRIELERVRSCRGRAVDVRPCR
ncbi:MAG: hypothetical protein AB7I04_02095 [Pseudomonadales bacterium]